MDIFNIIIIDPHNKSRATVATVQAESNAKAVSLFCDQNSQDPTSMGGFVDMDDVLNHGIASAIAGWEPGHFFGRGILVGCSMSNFKNDPYPDQRPGSNWFEERERNTRDLIDRQNNCPRRAANAERTRAEILRADPDAWENMAESWELKQPEQYECGNCGRKGDQTEVVEAVRRCGTGLGEWYCAPGQGCEK